MYCLVWDSSLRSRYVQNEKVMLLRTYARNLVPFARDSSSLRSSEWHVYSRVQSFVIPSEAGRPTRNLMLLSLGWDSSFHFVPFRMTSHRKECNILQGILRHYTSQNDKCTNPKPTREIQIQSHSIKEFFHPQRTEDQTEKPTLFPKKFQDNLFSEESCKHHTPITRSIVLIVTLLYKELLIKPFKNTKRITDLQSITRFDILSFKFHCILQQKKESFYSVTPVLKIAISR